MLAIARALVSNPRVLLLDEPSEGLAPIIVHEVGETLLTLKAEGHSILLVEQNTTLALRVADDVAILNTGRIVFDGSAAEAARASPTCCSRTWASSDPRRMRNADTGQERPPGRIPRSRAAARTCCCCTRCSPN